jgi:hypothetical protein
VIEQVKRNLVGCDKQGEMCSMQKAVGEGTDGRPIYLVSSENLRTTTRS